MTTYVRTCGGNTVHLSRCRYAVNYVPWLWAEGKSVAEMTTIAGGAGIELKWCRLCFPGVSR